MTASNTSNNFQYRKDFALSLVEEGFMVLPSCRKTKKPLTLGAKSEWLEYKRRDFYEGEFAELCEKHFDQNFGLIIPGGLIIVDADTQDAVQWCTAHLPYTPRRVVTGKGKHFYYTVDSQIAPETKFRVNDIDILTPGNFLVAPRSIHQNGKTYLEESDLGVDTYWKTLPTLHRSAIELVKRLKVDSRKSISVKQGGRNISLTSEAGRLFYQGFSFEDGLIRLKELNENYSPPLPENEVIALAKSIHGRELSRRSGLTSALLQNISEDSVALAFALDYSNQYKFIYGIGRWFQWDRIRWKEDVVGSVRYSIRGLSRKYNTEGKLVPARDSFHRGVEAQLKHDPNFATEAKYFDQDNYLLNCPDATYDLRTGESRPHDASDNITMSTAVSPSTVGGKRFSRFLKEITLEDESLQFFLQRLLGSCLSGAVEEHWLAFFVGGGRNGKNTLGEAVQGVLGDYARSIPSNTLMAQKHIAHPTEIMSLKGMRLVASSEIEEGSFWAESKIKELTGDEQLKGHYMRQDWVSFRRTHKHIIYGNYRPFLKNVDTAIKSRLKIIPFKANFAGKEDPHLKSDLEIEYPFILHWLLEGHAEWLAADKKVGSCEAVDNESSDYFDSQSTVESWIEERCVIELNSGAPLRYWTKASELYLNYVAWKCERGEGPISQMRFGEQIARKFTKRKAGGVRYPGLKLLS